MYSEFANDPKVQMMSEAMQRRLIMLFCDRSCDVLVTFCDEDIAFHWRISDGELAEAKALFIKKGFIDEHWNLLNWNKRQFISDTSTERTKRYRERKRTSQERHIVTDVTKCDALDTDTDTEADTEKSLSAAPPPLASSADALEAEASKSAKPVEDRGPVVGKLPLVSGTLWEFRERDVGDWREAFPAVDVPQQLCAMREWLNANRTRRKTGNGIRKFVVAWLSREQDKGGRATQEVTHGSNSRYQSPSAIRRENSHDAIKAAFLERDRRLGIGTFAGQDESELPESGAFRRDRGSVAGGLGGDRPNGGDGDAYHRSGSAPQIEFLPPLAS